MVRISLLSIVLFMTTATSIAEIKNYSLFTKRDHHQWCSPSSRTKLSRQCLALSSQVASAVGSCNASCYLSLFQHETGCRANLHQRRGQAGNAHAGYGICSLEASPAIRRANRRGRNCANIGSVGNQIRCCRDIMIKTRGRYFGPVNRGKVPLCR